MSLGQCLMRHFAAYKQCLMGHVAADEPDHPLSTNAVRGHVSGCTCVSVCVLSTSLYGFNNIRVEKLQVECES